MTLSVVWDSLFLGLDAKNSHRRSGVQAFRRSGVQAFRRSGGWAGCSLNRSAKISVLPVHASGTGALFSFVCPLLEVDCVSDK